MPEEGGGGRSSGKSDARKVSLHVQAQSRIHMRRHSWDPSATRVAEMFSGTKATKRNSQHNPDATRSRRNEGQVPWWKLSSFKQACVDEGPADYSESDVKKTTEAAQQDTTLDGKSPRQRRKGLLEEDGMRKRSVHFGPQEGNSRHPSSNNSTSRELSVPKRRSGVGNWTSPPVQPNGSHKGYNDTTAPGNGSSESRRKTILSIVGLDASLESAEKRTAQQRRATVHYSSSGRPSVMGSKRRSLRSALLVKEDRALDQIKDVCRECVLRKLKRNLLCNKVKINREPQPQNRWVVDDSMFVVNELQKLNKHLYRNISKQIGITLRSEEVIRKVFSELALEILTTESHADKSQASANQDLSERRNAPAIPSNHNTTEVTWGRIFAILAIAGGLAVDCVQQGHAELVNFLIEYCGEFAHDEGIVTWIVSEGGWESLRGVAIDDARRRCNSEYTYVTRFCNAVLAFVACLLAAVLVVAVIDGLSNSL